MRTLSYLLLSLALSTPAIAAGDLRVTAIGVLNSGMGSGPYSGLQTGDEVKVQFEVFLPPTVITPGTESAYTLDPATFSITRLGFPFAGTPDPAVPLTVTNNNPTTDGLQLLSTSLGNTTLFSLQATFPQSTYPSTDLTQWFGLTQSGMGTSGQMGLIGGWGMVGMMLTSLEVEDPSSVQYFCSPNLNSSGFPCRLDSHSNTGVGSGWHLDARFGPRNEFGYFLVGDGTPGGNISLGSGILCLDLTGQVGRYNVTGTPLNSLGRFDFFGDLANTVGTSTTFYGFDIPATVPVSGSPTILTGSTWHFQLWFRDAGTSNLSEGISINF